MANDAPSTPLRAVRLATGLSLNEVARRSGINKGRLSIIERGVTPTDDEASRILRVLSSDGTPERIVAVVPEGGEAA